MSEAKILTNKEVHPVVFLALTGVIETLKPKTEGDWEYLGQRLQIVFHEMRKELAKTAA